MNPQLQFPPANTTKLCFSTLLILTNYYFHLLFNMSNILINNFILIQIFQNIVNKYLNLTLDHVRLMVMDQFITSNCVTQGTTVLS
jgi:hypothetical protein